MVTMLKVKRLKAGSYEVLENQATRYFFYHRYEMEPTDSNGESTRGDWYVYEKDGIKNEDLYSGEVFVEDRFIDIAYGYKAAKQLIRDEMGI